jgi:hypothetical protein
LPSKASWLRSRTTDSRQIGLPSKDTVLVGGLGKIDRVVFFGQDFRAQLQEMESRWSVSKKADFSRGGS